MRAFPCFFLVLGEKSEISPFFDFFFDKKLKFSEMNSVFS